MKELNNENFDLWRVPCHAIGKIMSNPIGKTPLQKYQDAQIEYENKSIRYQDNAAALELIKEKNSTDLNELKNARNTLIESIESGAINIGIAVKNLENYKMSHDAAEKEVKVFEKEITKKEKETDALKKKLDAAKEKLEKKSRSCSEQEREKAVKVQSEKENLVALLTELNELEKNKDNVYLSDTCKSYLRSVYNRKRYSIIEFGESKYTEKGIEVEEKAIQYLSIVLNQFGQLEKNKNNYCSTSFIKGDCDVMTDEVIIDTKSSWSKKTFDQSEFDNHYEWQGIGYCIGYKREKFILAYVLVNTPLHLVTREKKQLRYKLEDLGLAEWEYNERYEKMCEQIDLNCNFDRIHIENKVKLFEVSYTYEELEKLETKINNRVLLCRSFLNSLLEKDLENEYKVCF